jgi:hypothetical protein
MGSPFLDFYLPLRSVYVSVSVGGWVLVLSTHLLVVLV